MGRVPSSAVLWLGPWLVPNTGHGPPAAHLARQLNTASTMDRTLQAALDLGLVAGSRPLGLKVLKQ